MKMIPGGYFVRMSLAGAVIHSAPTKDADFDLLKISIFQGEHKDLMIFELPNGALWYVPKEFIKI